MKTYLAARLVVITLSMCVLVACSDGPVVGPLFTTPILPATLAPMAQAGVMLTQAPPPGVTTTPTLLRQQDIAEPQLPRITSQELKRLMDAGVKVTLVDVRDHDTYTKKHIKDAICIPYAAFPPYTDEMIGSLLVTLCPQDQLIVLYGD